MLTTVKQTFFISDSSSNEPTKSARACNACYETVFPILDLPADPDPDDAAAAPESSSNPYTNTITSLANFPSWLSMPSLALTNTQRAPDPGALMSLNRERKRDNDRALHMINDDGGEEITRVMDELDPGQASEADIGPLDRVKAKAPSRPRSSYEILEDFVENMGGRRGAYSPVVQDNDDNQDEDGNKENVEGVEGVEADRQSSMSVSITVSEGRHSLSSSPRGENTVRRSKRFSLPAVALQTTSVVARTSGEGGRVKRFSLVLGGRTHGHGGTRGEVVVVGKEKGGEGDGDGKTKSELGRGVAARKLSELLGNRRG